jgi:hypothetical protein
MGNAVDASRQELLSKALEQLRSALELLDAASAPGQIGAHVDQAANDLYTLLAADFAGGGFTKAGPNARTQ